MDSWVAALQAPHALTPFTSPCMTITLPLPRGKETALKKIEYVLPENWLKPRPESGLDWLFGSKFARERFPNLDQLHPPPLSIEEGIP